MPTTPTEFQRFNAVRVPDWRYRRVLELVDAPRRPLSPSRTKDDIWVKQCWKFVQRYIEAGDDEPRRLRLFPKNPGLYYALLIHEHADREYRHLMEARILTRESDEQIAKTMSTIPATIEWYERLFYNVRDFFENTDWMLKVVQGAPDQRLPDAEGTITQHQRGILYRTLAFKGGALVLQLGLWGFMDGPPPRRQSDLKEWYENAYSMLMTRQGVIAGQTFQQNKFNVMQIFQMSNQMMAHDRQMRLLGGPKLELEQNIEEAFRNTPVLTHADKDGKSLPYRSHEMDEIELRAGEQLLMPRTGKVDILDKADRASLRARLANAKEVHHEKVQ